MAEPPDVGSGSITQRLDREQLLTWLREQRWFASKSQSLVGVDILEEAALGLDLVLTVAQVDFATGGHELYQIVLASRDGEVEMNAQAVPAHACALLSAIDRGSEIDGHHGRFYFRHVGVGAADGEAGQSDMAAGAATPGAPEGERAGNETVREMGAEQSNSSIVIGERLVLKLFRKLEPGINPELEMLRFLTVHDYPYIAPLHGWCEYEGDALAATLAVVQQFVPDATDGWELALAQIPSDPDAFLERLAELGSATARLHSVLSSDAGDPAFSPEEPSSEFVNLLRATLDEDLERVFGHLPDEPSVAAIAGREQDIRDLIRLPSQASVGGRSIRIHGDYHLGQTLHTEHGWTLIDFEGEPARPLNARRAKRSPLRDIASMLRSFSYATWAVRLQRGLEAPDGFEARARDAFLDAYFAEVDPTLLPPGQAQVEGLLAAFELQKALYELQYELDNRPDWVPIPVAGIARLLESG